MTALVRAIALGTALLVTGAAAAQEDRTVSEAFVLPRPDPTPVPFHVRGMDLGAALRLLLRDQGVSVVLDEGVADTVTIDLDSARTADILDLIARTHGLSYEFRENVLLVRERETRSFPIDLLERDPSEQQSGGGQKSDWEDIRTNLEKIKSPSGTVSIHERAGIVTAEDDPRVLDLMQAFLDGIQERLTRQVQIEARVVEVALGKDQEVGVDWSILAGALSNKIRGTTNGLAVIEQSTAARDGAFQIGILNPGKVDLFLNAIAERSDLRVVARPRVVTSSNRAASFQVTEKVPYIVKQVSREGGVAYTDFQVVFEEAGVKMEVTAQAAASGLITMRIHPVVSSVTGYTPSLPDLGPQPIVDVRETKTTLAVRNQETIVISGLIQERATRTTRGVPLLSSIPGLGLLFRHTSISQRRVELVVLLTPQILDPGTAERILEQDRLRLIERGIDLLDPELGSKGPAPSLLGGGVLRETLVAERTRGALAAHDARDHTTAVRLASEAVALSPGDPRLTTNLGLCLRDAGRLREAEAVLRGALDAAPAETAARNDLAVLLLHTDRADEAIDLLQAGLAEVREPAARAILVTNLAHCLRASGRGEEAVLVEEGLIGAP